MSRLVKWSVLGILPLVVVVGVLGGIAYHHATGARFEVRLTPTSRPPLPSACNVACTRAWKAGTWYRGTLTNTGHRGSYALCTVIAYTASSEQVFSNFAPGRVTWVAPGDPGPYVQAGQTYSWVGSIPVTQLGPVRRFSASCRSVDYKGVLPA